jgi:hypothetical protein
VLEVLETHLAAHTGVRGIVHRDWKSGYPSWAEGPTDAKEIDERTSPLRTFKEIRIAAMKNDARNMEPFTPLNIKASINVTYLRCLKVERALKSHGDLKKRVKPRVKYVPHQRGTKKLVSVFVYELTRAVTMSGLDLYTPGTADKIANQARELIADEEANSVEDQRQKFTSDPSDNKAKKKETESRINHENLIHPPKSQIPDYVYHSESGRYYYLVGDEFHFENAQHARTRLIGCGLNSDRSKGGPLSDVDKFLLTIRDNSNVHHVTRLAGWPIGIHTIDRLRVLVTSTFRLIEPKNPGLHPNGKVNLRWSLIRGFLLGLFGKEQYNYLLGHLKLAYEALRSGRRTGAPVYFIVGPADCGKSLLLNGIIKPLLGGRVANPFAFLSGQTAFNDELIHSEIHAVDDAAPFTDRGFARKLGGVLKEAVAASDTWCHPKGKAARTLPTYRRLFFVLNPEEMDLIPEINDSLMDKISILQAKSFELPKNCPALPAWDDEKAREEFVSQLHAELPFFIDYLVSRFTIAPDLHDRRFGQITYRNAEVMNLMLEASSIHLQHMLIQKAISGGNMTTTGEYDKDTCTWKVEIKSLYLFLMGSSQSESLRRMFLNPKSLGSCLGHMARSDKYSAYYRGQRSNGRSLWFIKDAKAAVQNR